MSSPTTAFEKSLRSFQTGGLTYGDFLDDLKQMLAGGASALEFQEILGRRQAIEPMSDTAFDEVSGVLNEAARVAAAAAPAEAPPAEAQSPADAAAKEISSMVKVVRNGGAVTPLPGGRPRPAARTPAVGSGPQLFSIATAPTDASDAGGAARAAELTAARSALEAAQNKTREITELARARISEAMHDTDRVRQEATQLRQALAERDLEVAGLQRERASIKPALVSLKDEHAKALKHTASVKAELDAARRALEDQRKQGAEGSAALTQSLAAVEAARDSERAARDTALAEHAAALSALKTEHAQVSSARDAAVAKQISSLTTEVEFARRALEDQRAQSADGSAALTEQLAAAQAGRDAERAAHATALAEHAAALSALKTEHAKALNARDSAVAKQISSLTAEIESARRALEDQRSKGAEGSTALAQKLAATEAARAEAVTALQAAEQQLRTADQQLRAAEHHQAEARQVREALAARDVELVALRQEQNKSARLLEARAERATQLQSDLTAARTRADSIEAELKSAQEAAARLTANLSHREAELGTARSERAAAQARADGYLESLRNRDWRQGYEHSRDVSQANVTPPDVTQPAAPSPAVAVAAASVAARAAPPVPGRSAGMRRNALLAAAGLVLIVVGWAIVRHKPAVTGAVAPSASAAAVGSVIQDCATCPTFTVLPAGRFKQGAAPGDPGYTAAEGPQHWVMLARPIALSTDPVTVDQFAQFVAATGRDMQGCETYDGAWKSRPDANWKSPGFTQAGNHPVTCVSYNDATAYAQWLSSQTGHAYRLPSASEWEYAARAGGTGVQPWDNASDACTYANVADASALHRYPGWHVFACDDGFANTSPVGSFKANAFGLNDMLGNVFQWTQDCWSADYLDAPIDGSARSNGDCRTREMRGGSWFSNPKIVRASYRNQFSGDYRTSSVGIRLVREL